jgi:hypothetical protein
MTYEEMISYPESAKRAREVGSKFYFTGERCSKNHMSLRYASSGNCEQCILEKRGIVTENRRGRSSVRSSENQKLAEIAHSKGFSTYRPANPCSKGHYNRYITTNNCVECNDEAAKKRKQRNKWRRIEKIYGITEVDFEYILNKQYCKCAICKTDLNNKNTHIDHSHKTGKVRGLLCSRCNQAIGLLDESQEKLKSAI